MWTATGGSFIEEAKWRASTLGPDPSSAASWEISELQFSPCKMRLKIMPASWIAVSIQFDNAYPYVAQLWYYVLWAYSKCLIKSSCLY